MASAKIHEVIAVLINKKYGYDETLLRLGTIAPDSWRNVSSDTLINDKYQFHFWDFRSNDKQANGYVEFYLKYYNDLDNPFYFGYLLHLIADQYWKTNVDCKYEKNINGTDYMILKDGSLKENINHFGYAEGLKCQKQLSKKYNLGLLPDNVSNIPTFSCNIFEFDLSGLFGENGTVAYVNKKTIDDGEGESIVYDNQSILDNIYDTVNFVESELERLKLLKEDYDKKIKIAVDIDDTLLSTNELEKYYFQEFLNNHPEIDSSGEYKWGDLELSLFFREYREKIAFGKVRENAVATLKKINELGYIVDLVSARPINRYSSLKKHLVEYLCSEGVVYNNIYLGFYSKMDFLKEHDYDILIDNELRYINACNEEGIDTILYGPMNYDYSLRQTDNWDDVFSIVSSIIFEKKGCVKR